MTDRPRRLAVVVGIRSQYIKLAALQPELQREPRLKCFYIDTGQHYDDVLAQQYVNEYALHFDERLFCGAAENSPTETFARMLVRLENCLAHYRAKSVVVFGDANTTLAAALSARRLGMSVAHLEAGVRTHAETPEELNRVIVDRISSLHLAATFRDLMALQDECLGASSVLVGDVVRELCKTVEAETSMGEFGLVAIHRSENTLDSAVVCEAIGAVEHAGLKVVAVFHPRVLRLLRSDRTEVLDRILALESVPHARILSLIKGARVVVTDSGALQRESFYLHRRAVVVQERPFWPTLVDAGHHIAVAKCQDLTDAVQRALLPPPQGLVDFGVNDPARRAVQALLKWVE